jgi:hypothetical protein
VDSFIEEVVREKESKDALKEGRKGGSKEVRK